MIENTQMMVRYDKWCDRCKHRDIPENDDPCEQCLDNPINENSEKPIYFEE